MLSLARQLFQSTSHARSRTLPDTRVALARSETHQTESLSHTRLSNRTERCSVLCGGCRGRALLRGNLVPHPASEPSPAWAWKSTAPGLKQEPGPRCVSVSGSDTNPPFSVSVSNDPFFRLSSSPVCTLIEDGPSRAPLPGTPLPSRGHPLGDTPSGALYPYYTSTSLRSSDYTKYVSP